MRKSSIPLVSTLGIFYLGITFCVGATLVNIGSVWDTSRGYTAVEAAGFTDIRLTAETTGSADCPTDYSRQLFTARDNSGRIRNGVVCKPLFGIAIVAKIDPLPFSAMVL